MSRIIPVPNEVREKLETSNILEQIRHATNTNLKLASHGVEVSSDGVDLYRLRLILEALGLGFPLDDCLELRRDDMILERVQATHATTPRNRNRKYFRIRGLLLGEGAENKGIIENFTGTKIRVLDKQVAILGYPEAVAEAKREVIQILGGRTRGTVQQFHRGKHDIPSPHLSRKVRKTKFVRKTA